MRQYFSFSRLSLVGQVALSVYGVLLIITTLVFLSAINYISSNVHEEMSIRLKGRLTTLMMISRNSAVVGDYASIEEALTAQAKLPDSESVAFIDPQQHKLIRWGAVRPLAAPTWFVHWLGIGSYHNSQALEVSGHHYGSVEVTISPNRPLNEAWAETRKVAVLSLLAYLITALAIFLVLQHALRPLEHLAHLADRIAQGDYAPRIEPAGCRELNQVIAMFNNMAAVLQQMVNNLHTQADALRHAKQIADDANRAKSNFLSTMSHEIRTPLNVIIGLTHLMDRSKLTPAQLDDLRSIEIASHNLLALINNILDFSKIESGELQLESRPFRLDEVLEEVGNMFQRLARNQGLQLILAPIPTELHEPLLGDNARLKQMLINLVGNAVKFTPHGEVSITPLLLPDNDQNQRRVSIAIRDSGIGIQPWELTQLFTPFKQAETTSSQIYGGTGLGLSIVKQLAELMGGQINVASTPGQGSTFTLTLPFTRATHHLPDEKPRHDPPLCNLHGLRVLVVDDVPMNLQVAYRLLEQQGMNATLCESGVQALRLLQERADAFDLILMDLQMPQLDGYDTARLIREQLRLSLPIIALTASATTRDRQRALAVGMVDFLAKPIEPRELVQVIAQYAPTRPVLAMTPPTVVESGTARAWPPINGVEMTKVRKLFSDDLDFFYDLLAQFVPDGEALLLRIQHLLQTRQLAEGARQLHKLKGLLGNLAADAALHATLTLEHAVNSGQDYQAPQAEFEHLMTQLLQSSGDCLQNRPLPPCPPPVPDNTVDWHAVRQQLANLRLHLENNQMDAANITRELAPLLSGSELAEGFVRLCGLVDTLQYPEALSQLNTLLTQLPPEASV